MVVHNCNPRTLEAEARGLRVGGKSGLHSKTLYQKIKQQKELIISLVGQIFNDPY
jgi:hypothetical protein